MTVNAEDRFAVYLRKSRADLELEKLGEGETLARHAEILRALAEKHGIHADQIDTYREVVSGETIQDRPQMQALLRAVSAKKYKAVLVVEIERLARGNTSDQGKVADAFSYSGTRIYTPQKIYDPANEFDQEYLEFGLFMSRREYKTIRRRLEAGKLQAAQEGQFIGTFVPYGYKAVRTSRKDRHLEPVQPQAAIVKRIFRMAANGKTPYQIAKALTLGGIPSPRSGGEWGKSTITRILQNPVYIGKIRWNNTVTERYLADDGSTKKRRVKSGNSILVDGKHEPLVDEREFNSIQGAFRASSPVPECYDMVNPLSGLLRCLKCGRSIVYVSPSKKAPRAKFSHKNAMLCEQASAPVDDVVNAITAKLKEILVNSEIRAAAPEEETDEREILETLQEQIQKQEARLKRIYDSYEAGVYSPNEFISRRQQAAKDLQSAKEQFQSATANCIKTPRNEQIARLHDIIEMLNNPSIPAKEKNQFLKAFISVIWYDNDGDELRLEIVLKA